MTTDSVETYSETYVVNNIVDQGGVRFVSSRNIVGLFLVGGVAISLLSVIATGEVDLELLKVAVVGYLVVAIPLCIAASLSRSGQLRQAVDRKTGKSFHRTIRMHQGEITIECRGTRESYRVQQCCWFLGRATDDRQLSLQPIRSDAVLIEFPTGKQVACGFSDEAYHRWVDILDSHGCRRVIRPNGFVGSCLGLLIIIGLIGGGHLGWQLGERLQVIVNGFWPGNQFVTLIPLFVGILMAWLLMTLPLRIPGIRHDNLKERILWCKPAVLRH